MKNYLLLFSVWLVTLVLRIPNFSTIGFLRGFLGLAVVFIFYLWVKRLDINLAKISLLVLCLNPWHIVISRETFWPNIIFFIGFFLALTADFFFRKKKFLLVFIPLLVFLFAGLISFESKNMSGLKSFLDKYLFFYSGDYLFFKGYWQNQIKGLNYQGVLYLADFFLLVLGFGKLLSFPDKNLRIFVLVFLAVSPLPAVFSKSVYFSALVFPLTIISALGISEFLGCLRKIKYVYLRRFFLSISVFGYLFFVFRFLDLYFVH